MIMIINIIIIRINYLRKITVMNYNIDILNLILNNKSNTNTHSKCNTSTQY